MIAPSRWIAVAGLLAFEVIGCRDTTAVDPALHPSFNRVKDATLAFDWSMPARFGEKDADGLVVYRRTAEEINPASWTVNFDACKLPRGTLYDWYVNKGHVQSVSPCTWTHEFPTEGTYNVSLHVTGSGPGYWVEQVVTVQDWLIVSFGDSYASGEGVPEIGQVDDATFASLNTALSDLELARQHLDAARDNLREAFERKGLAESVLATQQQRLDDFLAACIIDTFKDIAGCVQFLGDLPYDTFQTARDHFQEGVDNARERLDSLNRALEEAQAAFDAAKNAVANLEATIAGLRDGFHAVRWQPSGKDDGTIWNVDDCHRSANAAPARAALALERSDPHTSVTFIHLACTGAQVNAKDGRLEQQVDKAKTLLGSREIDAVLLSIGGNDAGFAKIGTACAVQQPCYADEPIIDLSDPGTICNFVALIRSRADCDAFFDKDPPLKSASKELKDGLDGLPARYTEVADVLLPKLAGLLESEQSGPAAGGKKTSTTSGKVRSRRVYITQYVDMTKNEAEAYCEFDKSNVLGTMPGMTLLEMEWLDGIAGRSINAAVATAAATHGWSLVTHIYDVYKTHGYCATDHWVNRLQESEIIEGSHMGIAHPNNSGQARTGAAIFATLMADLYPLGPGGSPRAADETSASGPGTAGVGPSP